MAVRESERPHASMSVEEPRAVSLAVLRTLLVRARPGGTPPVGGDAARATRIMEQELSTTAALWGQCGIELGAEGQPHAHPIGRDGLTGHPEQAPVGRAHDELLDGAGHVLVERGAHG